MDADTLEQLACYECPECGPMVQDDGSTLFSEGEAEAILGGDDAGFLRCPDCDAELDVTVEASIAMLRLIVERHPELAERVTEAVADALHPNDRTEESQ